MKKNSPRLRRGLEQELNYRSNEETSTYPVLAAVAIPARSIEVRQ
jgi:hypothetical protein